jgi:hypothetical protein
MPRVSEFFGIAIYIYYRDHAPPHFHARYQGDDAAFEIRSLALIEGACRPRVRALVTEWAAMHQAELLRGWAQAVAGEKPDAIEPL